MSYVAPSTAGAGVSPKGVFSSEATEAALAGRAGKRLAPEPGPEVVAALPETCHLPLDLCAELASPRLATANLAAGASLEAIAQKRSSTTKNKS